MAASEVTPAAVLKQESVVGGTAPKPPTVFTSKTGVKHPVLTDDRGPYIVLKAKKSDGTFTKVKRRIPPAEATPVTTAAPSVQADASTATSPATPAMTSIPAHTSTLADVKPVQTAGKVASPQDPTTASGNVPTAASILPSGNAKMGSRLLQRLGVHALAGAFIPDLDLGEMQDGDEPISDGDETDDDYGYDSDDNNNHGHNQDSGSAGNSGTTAGHSNSNGMLGVVANTGSQVLLNGAGKAQPPPAYGTTSLEKNKLVKIKEKDGKKPHAASKIAEVSQTEVNEKQVNNDSDIPGDHSRQSPIREAQHLSKTSIFIRIVIWFILIGFPLLFIVLGILTATIHDKIIGDQTPRAIHDAITIAVTAWPIVFAAIVAQSLRTLATWRVERGIKLMRLEQLISSSSVAAAVKGPFFLRQIDLVSIGLLLLWSLSPIASQALQRMSVPGPQIETHNVTYVDTTNYSPTLHEDSHLSGLYDIDINIMFGAALAKEININPGIDRFNNPLIPVLKRIANSTGQDGWIPVNARDVQGNGGFSAILGIPLQVFETVFGATVGYTVDMKISTSYLDFSCVVPQRITWADFLAKDLRGWNNATTYGLFMSQSDTNGSNIWSYDPYNFTLASARLVQDNATLDPSTDCSTNTNPNYTDIPGCSNSTLALLDCTFQRTYVDVMLQCNNTQCVAKKMRPTPNIHHDYVEVIDSMVDLSSNLAKVASSYLDGSQTILERWLFDPSSALDVVGTTYGTTEVDLASVDVDSLTKHLGQLVNTYWQIGFSPINIVSGLSNGTSPSNYGGWLTASAKYTKANAIYKIQWGWLGALFTCAGILLAAGVASAIFETKTVGPDVLGFASSIVRQSKYVRIPDVERGGTTMGGAERAKNLAGLVVMMQDVRPDREVGRIALGTVGENSKRLLPGRLYR